MATVAHYLFGFPLIVFPIIFLAHRVKRISKQIQKNQESFASVLIDFLGGIQTVKVFAMEDFSLKKYREQNHKMAALEQKSARYDLSSRPIVHTIGMFFLATALLYGLYVLHMSVSEVLVYCGLLYVFYEPIKKFAEENTHIQRGISAAERMQEVMDLQPQIEDRCMEPSNLETLSRMRLNLKMSGSAMRAVGVERGRVSRSAKGKQWQLWGRQDRANRRSSSSFRRLYDVQKGEICIDGYPSTPLYTKVIEGKHCLCPSKALFISRYCC